MHPQMVPWWGGVPAFLVPHCSSLGSMAYYEVEPPSPPFFLLSCLSPELLAVQRRE